MRLYTQAYRLLHPPLYLASLVPPDTQMKTKDGRLHNHFFGRCKKTYLKNKEITSIRMNVVFPVPFSPSNTIIWESLKLPFMIMCHSHHCYLLSRLSNLISQTTSHQTQKMQQINQLCEVLLQIIVLTLNVSFSSRKRIFSDGIKPFRKILIPSLTEEGKVTTPYAPGVP